MKRVALFGAGAEVDLGFSSGKNFTADTFYRSKTALYSSLRDYYKNRLGSEAESILPKSYVASFLLQPMGSAFKALVENIAKKQPDFVDETLGCFSDCGSRSLEQNELKKLYQKLIIENDSSDDIWRQRSIFDCLPADMHFGILESYYSELICPNEHPVRFWKLVNFYWSAFFSVALPICDNLYSKKSDYCRNKYEYILHDLNAAISDIHNLNNIGDWCQGNCYYNTLKGLFDGVITTNYTPHSSYVVNFEESRLARLSGSLSSFEELETLSVFDARTSPIGDNEFVFPYMMCQSPVKPIVDSSQLLEYSKAINMLNDADELIVLGYSFCREDTHIANLVRSAAKSNQKLKIIVLLYDDKSESYSHFEYYDKTHDAKLNVLRKIRLSEDDRLSVKLVSNCGSHAIEELQLSQ